MRESSNLHSIPVRPGQFSVMETDLKMNVLKLSLQVLICAALIAVPAFSETLQQSDSNPQAQTPVPTGTQTATVPAPSQSTQGSAPLRVMIGMRDIFSFERSGIDESGKVRGTFRATGEKPTFAERLATSGARLRPALFESKVEV